MPVASGWCFTQLVIKCGANLMESLEIFFRKMNKKMATLKKKTICQIENKRTIALLNLIKKVFPLQHCWRGDYAFLKPAWYERESTKIQVSGYFLGKQPKIHLCILGLKIKIMEHQNTDYFWKTE